MVTMKLLALPAAGIIAVTGAAIFLKEKTVDPLVPHTGALLCRSRPGQPHDSAAVVLRFIDGAGPVAGREVVAAFDSSGVPLRMVVFAPEESTEGRIELHVIQVRFGEAVRGARGVARDAPRGRVLPLELDGFAELVPSGGEELSAAEIARGRQLATGMWNRRCGRSLSASTD